MANILQDLDGVVCQMDNIVLFGKAHKEHDDQLTTVLIQIQAVGATLNRENCSFARRPNWSSMAM